VRQVASPPIGNGTWTGAAIARPRAEPLWESALVVVAALMFATSIADIFLSLGARSGHAPQVRLAYLGVYAAFGLMLFVKNALAELMTRVPLLALVLAMAPLSILWSVTPSESLERSVAVVGSSLFGAYLGWRFTLGRIIFLLAIAMAIASCLSLAVILLVPSVGIAQTTQWAGTWTGVNIHKSGLGGASALACLLIGYAIADCTGRWRLAFGSAFLIAFVLLIGSRSTSFLLSVLAIGALALWARHLQTLPRQVPVLTFIIILAAAITSAEIIGDDVIDSALALFGKRSDLSNRIPLWSIVWSFIENRFWLGYGYEAFWQPDTTRIRFIEAELSFSPYYAHNGLLETWLNGGLILVAMVFLMFVSVLARAAIIFARWREIAISSFPLFFCGYFLLVNFAESSVLSRNSLTWAILVAMTVFTAKWVRVRIR
jgi:exopolysaccharide production protein ExoQ